MTKKELDGIDQIDGPRIERIARGSGVPPQEVVQLLETHKQFEKMITNMSKSGLLKGGDAALASKIQRNPQAVMQQLQRSMDPRMLKQIGGSGNLMEMMKQMGGVGDMGKKMKEMMKGLGMS